MSSSVAMESSGGHVSHPVVDTGNGVGDEQGCLIDMYMHGQGLREVPSYGGLGCAEFVCPAHGRGGVTPSGYMDVSESCQVL